MEPWYFIQMNDGAFNSRAHKYDDTNAGISRGNITDESKIPDYFQLFFTPDIMNTIANGKI